MREVSLPLPRSAAGRWSAGLYALFHGLWRLAKEKPLGAIGGVIVLGLLLCAALAPWIATHPYEATSVRHRLKPPSAEFYLGTDNLGRDLFSRIVYGARISVTVGFGAVSLGTLLATAIGVVSGYFGGKIDVLMQRLVDAWMAFPWLVILLSIMAVLGPGLLNVVLSLGLLSAASSSRVIRSAVLSIKEHQFVEAAYRTGQIDCGPWHWWAVRQQDFEALKKSHPKLMYKDFVSNVTTAIYMRTDTAPFQDVRVRQAISLAVERQGLIDAVALRGKPTPAIAPGLTEWSIPIDQLGDSARYYQYDPKEARRLLAEAGYPKGFKTPLNYTAGYGRDLVDAIQLVQSYLKEVGIEAELKPQEYGAYFATTFQGKYEGMAMGPISIALEPDSVLYPMYEPENLRNMGHVNDPKIFAMLQEQRRLQDKAARKKLIFDIQRYIATQQFYVFLTSGTVTGTWQPYVKNYGPNLTFDYGGRAAALWLDK